MKQHTRFANGFCLETISPKRRKSGLINCIAQTKNGFRLKNGVKEKWSEKKKKLVSNG